MSWKYWIGMVYEEKKSRMKSAQCYWLVDVGWLTDIDLFTSMI